MDQNFSDILNIFKRLDEGMTKEAMWRDAERMTREQFCEKWGQEHAEFWDAIMGDIDESFGPAATAAMQQGKTSTEVAFADLNDKQNQLYMQKQQAKLQQQPTDEGSMANAEHNPSGAKFSGYWKGTDKNPPKPGMGVGGMEENAIAANYVQGASPDDSQSPIHNRELSLEEELMAEWEEFVREYGANEPAGTAQSGKANRDGYYTYNVVPKEPEPDEGKDKKVTEQGANNPAPGGISTPTGTSTTAQPNAQDAQAIKSNLQSLKSKVPGLDVNKATAALTTADANQPLDPQQNAALSKSLAGPLADVVKNPQLSGQLTQLINKGQQTATAQQKQQQAQQQQQGGTQ